MRSLSPPTYAKWGVETRKEGLITWRRARTLREHQELNNRMCCTNIKSEPRLQTFMFHTHPNPSCVSECVKLQSQWSCDEPKKWHGSVDLVVFLVCVQENMCTCDIVTRTFGIPCDSVRFRHIVMGFSPLPYKCNIVLDRFKWNLVLSNPHTLHSIIEKKK